MQTAVIKKTRATAMALCCLVLSATVFDAQAQTYRGAPSCGSWISEKVVVIRAGNERWLVGFLSGLAAVSNKDFIKGTDNESIFLWVDNYCQANPLKDVFDAGIMLATELIKQKKL